MSGLMFSSYEINPYTAMFLIIAQNSASRAFTTLILECGMCSDVSQRLICEEMLFSCVYAVKSSTQRNRRHRLQCSFMSNKLILVGPLIARHDHKISYNFSVMFFFLFFFNKYLVAQHRKSPFFIYTHKHTQVGVKRHTEVQNSAVTFQTQGRAGGDQRKMLNRPRRS